MFFDYERARHRQTLQIHFDPAEMDALTQEALLTFKNRNIPGIILLPLTYLIGGLASKYISEQQVLYTIFALILGCATLLRIMAIVALSRPGPHPRGDSPWISTLFWSNLLVGMTWGYFCATAILFYHGSLSITLIIIILAGIGAGAMATYSIWKLLAYSYLFALLLPPIVAEFYIGDRVTIPIGIAICFFLAFNLIQVNFWNRQYWDALINTFMISKKSLELIAVNERLNREIVDHQKTAQKIIVSRKKLEDIYNTAHDGIFIFGLDGQVLDSNDTLLKMFHLRRRDILLLNILKGPMTHPMPKTDLNDIWQKTLQGKDQEFQWQIGSWGLHSPTAIQVNLRRSVWGEYSVIIATVRDITTQLKALEATRAANRAKSHFLANMSHELRTPMHGILGYARLGTKRSSTLPRAKLAEYFFSIQESGSRLMDFLNKVLDFSKGELGSPHYEIRCHDMGPHICQVVKELIPSAAERGLRLHIECPSQRLEVFCDPHKIVQVLRNLLCNAITFSDPNSEIQILCTMTINARQQIRISNVGVAIPEDELETIFDSFVQSSATTTGAGGTGLGLAISRQIIQGHNSTIWAENGDDGKTHFCFLLPTRTEQFQQTVPDRPL